MTKQLTILGATGSIGTQALDVAKNLNMSVYGLSAHQNTALLEQQARAFHPRCVAIGEAALYKTLKTALADTDIVVTAGPDAVTELAAHPVQLVLNAVVGIAGLGATMACLQAKNTLALANKESLVTAGELVMATAKRNNVQIIPVDSEHSAIFQCLNGENRDRINKIILTASGGPFFGKTKSALENVTPAQALKHPNWQMGQKISIDSATLMNKGLELIEAIHLFDVEAQQVEIHVHRQSVLHSAVEFCDGSVMAQLGSADMRTPIQYAITYPDRLPGVSKTLSLFEVGALTFERADPETFLCLAAAQKAAELKGLYPCAVNGANEEAVALFLKGKISFLKIGELVEKALTLPCDKQDYNLKMVYEIDSAARELVRQSVQGVCPQA
ncbi:MAG: 1-deoxy-D-xylulose-5-phosphate reductoisomerase [Oscillospiraceae bacterium]|nr:1-deoxy-D-xylulose-5-phosphate reductoisomerase [Oscillospiraceae bacterium]